MKLSKYKIWARLLARDTVRNTYLEDLHGGTFPSSKKGDYSDVYVISPYGKIPWKKLSRISDEEMRKLMLEVEENIRKGLWVYDRRRKDKQLLKQITEAFFGEWGISWDIPKKKFDELRKAVSARKKMYNM